MKHYTHYLVLLLLILAGIYTTPSAAREAQGNLSANTPLCFIENKGQIIDQYGKTRKDIDFKVKANGLNIFIGAGVIHYQWYQSNKKEKRKNEKMGLPDDSQSSLGAYRMDVVLLGANKNATLTENETNGYYENYYTEPIGLKGATAHSFKRVIYKNVYPHIDWVLYISNGALKYDFVVHPGGDAKTIRLQYNGATGLELKNGNLIATTPYGSITEQAPYTYTAETHKEIKSNFILNNNILSYNIALPLGSGEGMEGRDGAFIIDPVLDWATYYGGNSTDYVYDNCTDSVNCYLTGTTISTNIATTGAYQTALTIGMALYPDAFLAKFGPAGNLLWATYYGGSNAEWAYGANCDPAGNIYISGNTRSATNIATAGAHQTTFAGPTPVGNVFYGDDFLAKFTASGNLLWATYYGGPGEEAGTAKIACDMSGNVVMTGVTKSATGIATIGGHQTSPSDTLDIYIVKFNSSGVRQWGTYYGGSDEEWVWSIDCDISGNILVSGYTKSSNGIATAGAHSQYISGGTDGLFAKFTTNGSIIWGTYFGGSGYDEVLAITCDASGNVFIGGRTYNSSGLATAGAYQTSYSSNYEDGFISKFNSLGVLQWSTYYGGAYSDIIYDIDAGTDNYLYITGFTTSSNNISMPGSYQPVFGGGWDNMFLVFANNGKRLYASYFGGPNQENSHPHVSCTQTAVYFTGNTNSSSNISSTNAYLPTFSGASDGFLAKFSLDTLSIIRQPFNDTVLCAGDTLRLQFDTYYKFRSNNTFTVQLSNASGSWALPVNIGTLATDTAGTVVCVIPAGTPTGAGYRVRIVASNPTRISADNGKDIGIGFGLAKPDASTNSPVCTGSSINLNATTTTSSTAVTWAWTGPNGYNATTQAPVISNATNVNSGSYIVTARLYGCRDSDTATVSILPLPAAAVTASSNAPVCTNDTLKLFATNTLAGTTYYWTGPNTFSANTQNTSIIYPPSTADGDYVITATLNGCSIKDTVTILTKAIPANVNATGNSPICDHSNFTMSVTTTTTGVGYSWAGPGSYSAAVSNPTLSNISFVNSGDYIATVSINGCSVKDTVTLVVNPLPAKPVATSNTPICTTDTLRLNATTTTTGVGYSWTGPNGFTSPAQNPSVNNPPVAAAGDYIVTATITATGCAAKDTATVAITQSPSVSATNSSPVCEGSTVSLSAAASPATAVYSWSGPGSFSSPSQNPVISNAATTASGDYIVSATLNGCTGKDTTTVVVKPNPIMPVTNSNTPVCIGGTLNLTAASNASSTYSWTGPNSFSSTLQNPARTGVTAADAGTYAVIATLNGCVSPAGNTTVVVNPQPFVTIYATPADSICQGSTATFVALPANTSSSVLYKWTKNSSPAVLGTANTLITSTLNNNDIVRCEITEAQKCGVPFTDTSNEVKMTVLPWVTPAVSISANPSAPLSPYQLVSFTAVPVNGGSTPQYQWTRNGTSVIGASAAGWSTQQLSNNDVICVSMTSSEKCPQPKTVQSNCIKVTVLTGVAEVDNNARLQLYPNPNDGRFIIHAEDIHATEVQLEIVNATGQLVYRQKAAIHNNTLHEPINIQPLAAGVYLLKLEAGGKTYTQRFTVDR